MYDTLNQRTFAARTAYPAFKLGEAALAARRLGGAKTRLQSRDSGRELLVAHEVWRRRTLGPGQVIFQRIDLLADEQAFNFGHWFLPEVLPPRWGLPARQQPQAP